jgi:SAM-dependent methyltransferase
MQRKQDEWNFQWNIFFDHSSFLFKEWIAPNTLASFTGKTVLDCGCGAGQHISFVAPYAKNVTGVDLNTSKIAKKNNAKFSNVRFVEADIASMSLRKKFDIVYSIGVIHHTDDPDKTFKNIKAHVKKGGKLIIWVYAWEGNFLNRTMLEFLKKIFILKLNKKILLGMSYVITTLLYIPIYTIYLLPLRFLPFYQYFQNWRKLSFTWNNANVFDKFNAPQTHFIKEQTVKKWFNSKEFKSVHIAHYKGVSWRASGTKK